MTQSESLPYGLLGEHLSHSFSPQIHAELASYEYKLFPTPHDELDAFLKSRIFAGLNVTIPYKQSVIPYCTSLSPIAARVESVNTITISPEGELIGNNTDYYGFCYLLKQLGVPLEGKKALVLGSGGASKTISTVLSDLGCTPVIVISRTSENNYDTLYQHADAELIVNTTPVGMYPDNGTVLIDLDTFPKLKGVADIIFNPLSTNLLLQAKHRNIPCINGLSMLVAQAKLASELFTGTSISDTMIDTITSKILQDIQNIILIGMPGCGKSTVAYALSDTLGRPVVDTDELILDMVGRTPAELIEKEGESVFRQYETAALKEAGKLTGKIIATGGGVVTRPENYDLLHQNGILIFINRPISELPTTNRPLSKTSKMIEDLYQVRLPLYREFADYEVPAGKSVDTTASAILKIIGR